jgi:hypothetical protein
MTASAFTQPLMIIGSLLGAAAVGLIIVGLIFATQGPFIALAITLLALWIVTTMDHAAPVAHERPLHTGARTNEHFPPRGGECSRRRPQAATLIP